MRDPRRIETVLTELKKLWYEYPDMRFGQLISLIVNSDAAKPTQIRTDIFFPEDDVWLDVIKKMIEDDSFYKS